MTSKKKPSSSQVKPPRQTTKPLTPAEQAYRYAEPGDYRKHPRTSADYQRLLDILRFSPTDKQVAEKLGVSPRTLSRWKKNGIPPKTHEKKHADFVRVAANTRKRVFSKPTEQRPEPRQIRTATQYSDIVFVRGQPLDAVFETVLRYAATRQPAFSAYRFILKFNQPFSGIWDGKGTLVSEDDLQRMPKAKAREARKIGSWLDTANQFGYVSTRLITLEQRPEDHYEDISRFFGQAYYEIDHIIFKKRRIHSDDE